MKTKFVWLIESNISSSPSYYTGEHNQQNNPCYSFDADSAKIYPTEDAAKKEQVELRLSGKPVEHGFLGGLAVRSTTATSARVI